MSHTKHALRLAKDPVAGVDFLTSLSSVFLTFCLGGILTKVKAQLRVEF